MNQTNLTVGSGRLWAIVFVAHTGSGSKTEAFCREILSWKKPIYTFESEYNKTLIGMGAQLVNKIKQRGQTYTFDKYSGGLGMEV